MLPDEFFPYILHCGAELQLPDACTPTWCQLARPAGHFHHPHQLQWAEAVRLLPLTLPPGLAQTLPLTGEQRSPHQGDYSEDPGQDTSVQTREHAARRDRVYLLLNSRKRPGRE